MSSDTDLYTMNMLYSLSIFRIPNGIWIKPTVVCWYFEGYVIYTHKYICIHSKSRQGTIIFPLTPGKGKYSDTTTFW